MTNFNIHEPVLLDEVKKFISISKKINVIDATFGGGGYSRALLEEYKINQLVAIDRDPITEFFAKDLSKRYKNFKIINGCFSKIDELIYLNSSIKVKKFDVIIFDLGLSSNQINNPKRGFSFMREGPLDMNMGGSNIKASEVINNFSEKKLANIFFELGEEKYSKRIARNIVQYRKLKLINSTKKLSELIKESIPKINSNKTTINPATRTFQALRIYVNDELNELKTALSKASQLLNKEGRLIVVSFQSLEDRIVKDFLSRESGKRWRSSRHYPELVDKGPITFKLITKKPIRPQEWEVVNNPRSRSAKLRVAEKIN